MCFLTGDSAVQIALLNNRALRATLEEIGISRADLIQAGLLRNPEFSAAFPSMSDFRTGKYIVGSKPLPTCSATQPAPCLRDPNNAYVQQNVLFTGSSKFRSDDYKLFGPRFGSPIR